MKLYPLVKFNLNIVKKQVLGWCVALFAVTFLYMILFPSVKDMAQMKMDAMPEELMQFMGMENLSDMGNFVTYFGMIYNLLLIAISIFAAMFTASILAKEEHQKTIEFLYALPVCRAELYSAKCITAFLALVAVVMSAGSATLICGVINGGETFVVLDVLQILKFSSITPFVFLFMGLLISGLSTKISGATLSSMVVLVLYTLGSLSGMLPEDCSWLAYASPFEQFSPEAVLAFSEKTMLALGGYTLGMGSCFIIGLIAYQKRDFNI